MLHGQGVFSAGTRPRSVTLIPPTLPQTLGVAVTISRPAEAVKWHFHTLTVIYKSRHIARVTAFEVLSEPNRRWILDLLLARERPVGDLVEAMGASQPAVSKHLRVLRQAGLVECRVDAQRRVYRVRPEPLRDLDAWLSPYRALWASRLDALEGHLAAMAPSSPD
jgi:DNA-binding transcriptional ArsR family regulator